LRRSRAWTVRIAWIVLTLASIPIVLDYLEHVFTQSWAWYAGALFACAVSSLWRAKRRASRVIPAILLILIGIALEIFASASGVLRLGRPGFVLAASGIVAADGRLDLRRFVIMALAVPIPHALLERIGEPLLFVNFEMLARTLQMAGVPALVTAHGVERSAGLVTFVATDVGWTSAIFGFGLAWVLFERRGSSWGKTVIGSCVGIVAGFVIHLLCTTVLFALVEPSSIADTRIWRDALSFFVIVIGAGSYWVLRLRADSNTR
jgi:hypothetical protein